MTNPADDSELEQQHDEIRRAARRFLAAHATPAQTRAAMATARGWDAATWSRMAGELGWAALALPEAYGGVGGSFADLAVVLEETGRALACAPLFSTVCLGAAAILELGDEAQRAALLPAIASGAETATLAVTERGAGWEPSDVETTFTKVDGGWRLAGTKRYVVDGHTADRVVVVAREAGSRGAEGIAAFVVAGAARGVERRGVGTMDQTRKLAEITLRDAIVADDARLANASWAGVERVYHRACVALAAEQVGAAARCLEMAVEYAKVRTQFGRPIGSFQAVKHQCADMLVDVESARSASLHASRVASASIGEGATDDELAIAASMTKSFCSEALFRCASTCIQVHGGIGFTWEHDAHLYFKRARSSSQLLGDPTLHRDRVAQRIGLR
jgi:alkylation response protein AidB-like acyl-CoA dehydrogenase